MDRHREDVLSIIITSCKRGYLPEQIASLSDLNIEYVYDIIIELRRRGEIYTIDEAYGKMGRIRKRYVHRRYKND